MRRCRNEVFIETDCDKLVCYNKWHLDDMRRCRMEVFIETDGSGVSAGGVCFSMHLDYFKVQFQGGTKYDLHSGGYSGVGTGAFGVFTDQQLGTSGASAVLFRHKRG